MKTMKAGLVAVALAAQWVLAGGPQAIGTTQDALVGGAGRAQRPATASPVDAAGPASRAAAERLLALQDRVSH